MKKFFWKRRKILLLLALLLLFGKAYTVSAAESLTEGDDPQAGRYEGYVSDDFYDSVGGSPRARALGQNYSHASKFNDYTIKKGIDVSKYQGNINWSRVKADGVDFAFVRLGYRGYGSSGTLNKDMYYDTNMKGAANAGLDTGIYFFSQATNLAEAREEANYVLSNMGNYHITLPIAIDFEYASGENGSTGRLYDANLSVDQATAICREFCRVISAAGYKPMVYANKYMLTNRLNASAIEKDYKIWLANYTQRTEYAGKYEFWQYSSTEYVDGISGRVDADFWYIAPDNSIKTGWNYIAGKWYYYDQNKVKKTGWLCINSVWYYLDSSGAMQIGWLRQGNAWYYLNSNGVMQTGWLKLGNTWYYMNSSGVRQTGWLKLGNTWYYMNSNGAMQTGWLRQGNTWYYLNNNGAMQTGWLKLGNTWYYMNSSGVRQTGWLKLGNIWYYMNNNGAMQTGWLKIGKSWYYFNGDGAMWIGWLKQGNAWYYLRGNGAMATSSWIAGQYYVNSNGVMLTNTWTPDGYYVGSDGRWNGKR